MKNNNNKIQKLKVYLDYVTKLENSNPEGPKRDFFSREVRKTKHSIEVLVK